MGVKTPVVRFRYTIGMTFPFVGDTISFASVCGSNQILAPCYEGGIIGFSMAGNSGTFGVRWFLDNPAVQTRATANSLLLNPPTALGVAGSSGIGASAGFFTWGPSSALLTPIIGATPTVGLAGLTWTNWGSVFPTPDYLSVERAAGASVSGSLVIAGFLWAPVN